MAGEKERILESAESVGTKLCDWIHVSYEYFDRYPDAFTYVLLTDHVFADDPEGITRRQGRMLTGLLAEAIDAGQMSPIDPVVAMSHFTGVMLNVPRLINEGTLPAPASAQTAAVGAAVCRIFDVTCPRKHPA
jgi:hypothetical protein